MDPLHPYRKCGHCAMPQKLFGAMSRHVDGVIKQKVVAGHRNDGGERREISEDGTKTVPQESEVTASAEERVEEDVEREEHGQRGVQRGACAVRLVQ